MKYLVSSPVFVRLLSLFSAVALPGIGMAAGLLPSQAAVSAPTLDEKMAVTVEAIEVSGAAGINRQYILAALDLQACRRASSSGGDL